MRQKFLIIIINFLYVTANKPLLASSSYENLTDQLVRHWNINDNESRCQFDVNRNITGDEQQQQTQKQKYQPLFIHPNMSKFLHPIGRTGVITMRHNDEMKLFCSAGFSHPSNVDGNLVHLRCMEDGHFQLNNDVSIADVTNQFECRKHPFHIARRRLRTNERCFNNATIVDIGFEIGEKFLIVLTVCHDERVQCTYYSNYKITPANIAFQHGVKRPSFIQANFFPEKNVNLLYSREHQRKIISEFIAADVLMERDPSNVFLSRGHLAAKADFIYGNEQRATFYYINIAPQWQRFNSLNWQSVEDGSRRLAADRNITLNVYTGTHGIISMNNSMGIAKNVYLDMVNKQIPIPKLFYKLLIDAKGNAGIALVCANNIHTSIDEIQRDYIICEDVSDEIRYIKWKRRDVTRGYCYACHVDEFLEKVPHVKLSNDDGSAFNLLT